MRALAPVLGLALLVAWPAWGDDLTSPSYTLRGASLTGGTAVGMTSTAPAPRIGSLGASIGQSEPIGFSGSVLDLTTLASGFWPIVATAFPTLDADADGLQAFRDNCPFEFNPAQTPSLDDPAIGFACLCGDVNDDGTVDALDVVDFRFFLADPGTLSINTGKCTVIDPPSQCDVLDVTVIRRVVEGPDLPPGIGQVCAVAAP